jgi:hypothetical protein
MPAAESSRSEFGHAGYEMFVGGLSVLSPVHTASLCPPRRAPHRKAYALRRYGWTDLLSSSPAEVAGPSGSGVSRR